MIEVHIHDKVEDHLLKFAVIISKTNGKWVFCKHKERNTYEIPGGHREVNEKIDDTAKRELKEETGAIDFTIRPICAYSVKDTEKKEESFGMLYVADITSFEKELHNEIEQILITNSLITNWTYPLIQPILMNEIIQRGIIIEKEHLIGVQ